jgi:predicted metalloendopeptidase
VVLFPTQAAFGQTNENNALPFLVDPDGMVSSVKSVGFALYYSGQFRSGGTYLPDTVYYENGQEAKPHLNPNPQYDPHWFTWDQ